MTETPSATPPPDQPEDTFIEAFLDVLVREDVITPERLRYAKRVQQRLETPRPVLVVLSDLGLASLDQLRQVFRKAPQKVKLGRFLVEFGLISEEELETALTLQQADSRHPRLGEVLVERNLLSESKLVGVLADLLGHEALDLGNLTIDTALLSKLVLRTASKYGFIPIERRQDKTLVAFGDPLDASAFQAARDVLGTEIVPAIARRTQIDKALENSERTLFAERKTFSEQSTVTLVNLIFEDAIRQGASDIHIETLEHKLRIRFRIDGVMVLHKDLPVALAPAVTSRIKVIAGADIAERRRHQDGRVLFELPSRNQSVDMRASFFSTIHGETVVLRLLNRKTELLDIRENGMAPAMQERFIQDALEIPNGIVIVTGPTGSGKTTTLYSSVDYLNDPEVSIITAEDPVEYVIDGISQCSINPKINLTFEETLRHVVRQDPDIIVLGEIRDRFSAETAIQAALTGHKVLTTFHTEDSIGGILRLMNMDIEAFLIASTLISVVAQRLVRKVCKHCGEPAKADPAILRRLGTNLDNMNGGQFRRGRGCPDCRFTGYSGRICVFEVLNLNEQVRDAIVRKSSSFEIRRIALDSAGLITMLEDGLVKAAAGITTLEEILENLPRFRPPRPLAELRRLLGIH